MDFSGYLPAVSVSHLVEVGIRHLMILNKQTNKPNKKGGKKKKKKKNPCGEMPHKE
jgi:hypothetical protein